MTVTCDDCGFVAIGEADYDTHDKYEDHPFRSDDAETLHVTRVIPVGRDGMYRATCSICGRFGRAELLNDARAIADRHAAVQGFERG